MESSDRDGHDRDDDPRVDSLPTDESAADPEDSGGLAQVVGTYDSSIASGPGPRVHLEAHPDRIMVIETHRIREPDGGYPSNLTLVPVDIRDPAPEHQSKDDNKGENPSKGGQGRWNQESKGSDHPRSDDKHPGDPGKKKGVGAALTSSPMRLMLLTALIALVCGVGGAWGYSHFFGSEKSKDQGSSGQGSDSSKKSQSGQSSDSSKGSESGKGSKPGEGPGSGRDSDESRNDADQGRMRQEQQAWMTVMKELQQARDGEKAARQAEDEKKAVLEFFKMTLLSAGRPGDASLSQAFWSGGQGKDVTLRKAVDTAESRVSESFADRPTAEATVREMLGSAYLNLGDPSKSVTQYERALALRQAMQGFDAPETAACRNQLAVAYRLADRPGEGGRLFDRNTESITQAAALSTHGMTLLLQGKPAEAEIKLRESLAIRQKAQPDDWSTFSTRSALGEAILDQGKFAEAEPLLLSGYEGLKQREALIPAEDRPRLARSLEQIVRLYDTWGKDDLAKKWRKTIEDEVVIHKTATNR